MYKTSGQYGGGHIINDKRLFYKILSSTGLDTILITSKLKKMITNLQNNFLLNPSLYRKSKMLIFSMHPDKFLRLDGFNPGFY